jgi:hypothetical protein
MDKTQSLSKRGEKIPKIKQFSGLQVENSPKFEWL